MTPLDWWIIHSLTYSQVHLFTRSPLLSLSALPPSPVPPSRSHPVHCSISPSFPLPSSLSSSFPPPSFLLPSPLPSSIPPLLPSLTFLQPPFLTSVLCSQFLPPFDFSSLHSLIHPPTRPFVAHSSIHSSTFGNPWHPLACVEGAEPTTPGGQASSSLRWIYSDKMYVVMKSLAKLGMIMFYFYLADR